MSTPEFILCDLLDPDSVLPIAKAEGLGVELQGFSVPDVLDDPASALAEHRDYLHGFSGRVALHAPFSDLFPGSRDSLVRLTAWTRIQQCLAVAKELGVSDLVAHYGYIPGSTGEEDWLKRSAAFWARLLGEMGSGMRLHLENVAERAPETLAKIVDKVGDPRLGVCLDVGHAHALSGTNPMAWVEALGRRITYVHLSDNWGADDDHAALGHGNLPLRETLRALERCCPGAALAIEAPVRPSLAWLRENEPELSGRSESGGG